MEISVAQHLATLNASLFIIDCDWNMDGPTVAGKKTAFFAQFYAKDDHFAKTGSGQT
jgi:hypothetical protein